ncbi:MAG: hypothetical protein A2V93_00250 [Ignavibacteria bacterium RBG_16_34_14]|nr:MAG: hypothetical protein A2V93_00250 [Ignavibacteria bacterium RBG_16_34_14]
MQLVPDWAPNIHPMIVHFPLVLLILAVLLDVTGLFLKKDNWLTKAGLLLYLLGTIAAVLAFLTGRAASDNLAIPANTIPAVNDHTDWAEITLWFFIIYTIVRLAIGIILKSLTKIIVIPMVLIGFLGIYFLYQTGDRGAKLVFGYGLGTGNIINLQEGETKEIIDDEQISDSTFIVNKNGSWKLVALSGINKILSDKFTWIEGSPDNLGMMYDEDESVLMFHQTKEVPTLSGFVYDNKIKSVQVTAKINIDDFNGELELVHHFIDKNNYDFLGLINEKISLSRKTNGEVKIFEEDKFQNKGFIEIKVESDGTHFRGYVNNKMIVHGHDSEPKPGSVGMKFSGSGSISIKMINVESLKK